MRTGDVVADFELPDQDGKARTLSEFLEQGPVVLFFYPAAFTPGCRRPMTCTLRGPPVIQSAGMPGVLAASGIQTSAWSRAVHCRRRASP